MLAAPPELHVDRVHRGWPSKERSDASVEERGTLSVGQQHDQPVLRFRIEVVVQSDASQRAQRRDQRVGPVTGRWTLDPDCLLQRHVERLAVRGRKQRRENTVRHRRDADSDVWQLVSQAHCELRGAREPRWLARS